MTAIYEIFRIDPRILSGLIKSVGGRGARSFSDKSEDEEEVKEQKRKVIKKTINKTIKQVVDGE